MNNSFNFGVKSSERHGTLVEPEGSIRRSSGSMNYIRSGVTE